MISSPVFEWLLLLLQVSQGDATEKLAHQVAAQVAAADRRVEEASGDPHEEEKDEAHKSSKGHVSGKYGLCCMEECWTPPTTKTRGRLTRDQVTSSHEILVT